MHPFRPGTLRYAAIFPQRHTLLPVIHAVSEEQVLRNVSLAIREGAHGVFLIGHRMNHARLFTIYEATRAAHPTYWIGMNCLDLPPWIAMQAVPDDVDGLWSDQAGIDEHAETHPSAANTLTAQRHRRRAPLYFGGVAFKYQKEVADPGVAAAKAVPYVDVITTSGAGTGSAPDPEKIMRMRAAVGDAPIAIASGMTPENIREFLDADCFLVATGISKDAAELSASGIAAFLRAIG